MRNMQPNPYHQAHTGGMHTYTSTCTDLNIPSNMKKVLAENQTIKLLHF